MRIPVRFATSSTRISGAFAATGPLPELTTTASDKSNTLASPASAWGTDNTIPPRVSTTASGRSPERISRPPERDAWESDGDVIGLAACQIVTGFGSADSAMLRGTRTIWQGLSGHAIVVGPAVADRKDWDTCEPRIRSNALSQSSGSDIEELRATEPDERA